MTITQLEYVLAVDQFRHFGQAAHHCHVTQPTLSVQLQKLEEELGVILFDRSKNPILPTPEGEAVISQARIVLREFQKIFEVIKEKENFLSGTFRLAVIPTLAPYIIPLFAASFYKKHPKVELIIEEYKTEDIIDKLKRDEVDAGLVVTPLHEKELVERVLCYEPFYVFASQDHPLFQRNKVKESDLNDNGMWLLSEGHCFRDQFLKVCSMKAKKNTESQLKFESGNLETLKNMVLKVGGYTLLPYMATKDLSTSQKKCIREFTKPIPTREISLVYSRLFLKEKVIDALEEEILSHLPSELSSNKNKEIQIINIL